jgi:prevent-host-death family protein
MAFFAEGHMETYSIRDLRERTGELVRSAEQGRLSVVAKHGHPLFVAVPLDEAMLRYGVNVALAIKLFQEGVLSLGKAAKLAGLDYEAFVERLGSLGIAAVDYAPEELDRELAAIE